MKIYIIVLTLVAAGCALDLAFADILKNLESHLKQANIREERGGTISEALRYVDTLGLITYISSDGIDKSFVKKGLNGLRAIASWNDNCFNENVLKNLKSASKLLKELPADGILRPVAQNAVDKFYDRCGKYMLELAMYKKDFIDNIGTIIEEISASKEVGSLCDKIDRTKVDWQYDCISKISHFDTKAFAPGIWAGLKRLDRKNELEGFVNKATSKSELAKSIKPEVDAILKQSCFKLTSRGGVPMPEHVKGIFDLVKATSRPLDETDVQLTKRLESGIHFCSFLPHLGNWVKGMTKTLAAYAYN